MDSNDKTKKHALVTGASSGIGRELSKLLAADGYDLVLVARRLERLQKLADEFRSRHGTQTLCLKEDLADPESISRIRQATDAAGVQVDVLVNDAGFGHVGKFAEIADERTSGEIAVNILALTRLTRAYLPGMISRGSGSILNVASVAGYLAGPWMAVYHATKAYVISFSEALSQETHGTGVSVTCLCPGRTRTEFFNRAYDGNEPRGGGWMDAQTVAKIGYKAMLRRHRIVNAGWGNAFVAGLIRCTPHWLLLRVMARYSR